MFKSKNSKVNELAEALKRTEEELRKLISEHRKTREQLGGLSHTVGYILEDRSYAALPYLLIIPAAKCSPEFALIPELKIRIDSITYLCIIYAKKKEVVWFYLHHLKALHTI